MIILEGRVVEFETFPNGEIRLGQKKLKKIVEDGYGEIRVVWKFENDSEIFRLGLLVNALKSVSIRDIRVVIPYMPYSRMDRKNEDFAFSLSVFSDLMEVIEVNVIETNDLHSDFLLEHMYCAIKNKCMIGRLLAGVPGADHIILPDKGAYDRYRKLLKKQYPDVSLLYCDKSRDFSTGRITSISIKKPEKIKKGDNVVIVDDLCSYGGTFMGIGSELKKLGVNEINLVVSHCETSILDGLLLKKDSPITKVYTTNSIISETVKHDKLSITDILEIKNSEVQ